MPSSTETPAPPVAPAADAAAAEHAPESAADDGPDVSDEDISRLAANEGWAPDEVDALRAYLVRGESVDVGVPDPGTRESASETQAPPIDQDWLRGRRGPAATAYRRLRRLFQN